MMDTMMEENRLREFDVEAAFEKWYAKNFELNSGGDKGEWVKKKLRPIFLRIVGKAGVPPGYLDDFVSAMRLKGYEDLTGSGHPGTYIPPTGGTPAAASLDRLAA